MQSLTTNRKVHQSNGLLKNHTLIRYSLRIILLIISAFVGTNLVQFNNRYDYLKFIVGIIVAIISLAIIKFNTSNWKTSRALAILTSTIYAAFLTLLTIVTIFGNIFSDGKGLNKLYSDTLLLGVTIILFCFFLVLLLLPTFIDNVVLEHQLSLDKERMKLKDEQISLFASITHELGNKIPTIQNDITTLNNYFSTNPDFKSILDRKIRNPLPGEQLSEIDTLNQIFNRLNEKIGYSINVLIRLGEIIKSGTSKINLETIPILEFIREYVAAHRHDYDGINFNYIGSDQNLVLDRVQLSIFLNNILNNAIRHGFSNYRDRKIIEFEIRSEHHHIELFIRNSGNPIPDDYTVEQFKEAFNYSGISGNMGIGGYLIGKFISDQGGSIEISPKDSIIAPFNVQLIVRLPINKL